MTSRGEGRAGAAIEIARGARAAETRLLEILAEHRDDVRADPARLERPVRVVVPSRSLRLHVSQRIVVELGTLAGVSVQTLHGVASEVLDRAGVPVRGGDLLAELLAQRLARAHEPALREALAGFESGFRAVVGSVRDLLDAGFEPEHEEAALECVEQGTFGRVSQARAAAVVRTARRVLVELRARGLMDRSELQRAACEALERDPDRVLPARAVLVHGFADVTGRAGDLIEALARRRAGRVIVDRPGDPADPTRVGLGAAWTERFVERLRGALGEPSEHTQAGDVALERRRAPGAQAEVRAVARAIRADLEQGVRPERLAIVARDLRPYRAALREQLDRLGIPYSGIAARAPLDGTGARLRALADLLDLGARTPTDRWLDAVGTLLVEDGGETVRRAPSARLRLALRVLGAARLEDAARIDPERAVETDRRGREVVKLPVRLGISANGARQGDPAEAASDTGSERAGRSTGRVVAPRATVPAAQVRAVVAAAKRTLQRLRRWSRAAAQPVDAHLAQLEKLRRVNLGWSARDRAEQNARSALERLRAGCGGGDLDLEELAVLVRRVVANEEGPRLGGQGGGVQVLSAMEARARTFGRLFLIGLNRDAFPRVPTEDALLPDAVRVALTAVLPDTPVKARARDEDRYLFAQLASASPLVSLSWCTADDDGRPRVSSPLVDRLPAEEEEVGIEPAVFPRDARELEGSGPRSAREHAILGGLFGGRTGFGGRLRAALLEADPDAPADAVAAARARVLTAHESGPREPWRLAPWLGFLGDRADRPVRPDPRDDPLFVTRYEDVADCPWQMFLTKVLRIEESPDPLDRLPGLDARVVGIVAHEAIERIVHARTGDVGSLAEALERDAVPWRFPDDDGLAGILDDVARRAVAPFREPVPGLLQSIAGRARVFVDRMRALAEEERDPDPRSGVLGAEIEGETRVDVAGEPVTVRFRADLVERRGETVVLTDLKTGKPIDAKALRKKDLARGLKLQALAYALGASAGGREAVGRYVFLKAAGGEEPVVDLGDDGSAFRGDFERALSAVLDAWSAGSFFPRMLKPHGDATWPSCKFCHVREACLQHDSGARRALDGLAEAGGPSLTAFRTLWALAAAEHEEGS